MELEIKHPRKNTAGWQLGFGNQFRKEIAEWLKTRRWLIQSTIWTVILNGFIAAIIYNMLSIVPEGGEALTQNPFADATIGYFGLGGMALSIGIIILTQNEIIGEKQSGTAEWVLSKPLSRSAFFLSKLSANLVGMLVVMVLVPSAVAYTQLAISHPDETSLAAFLAGAGMLTLHVFFYLSLTLMMGVIAENRGPVLGVSLGTLLLGMILRDFVGRLTLLTPWMLADFAGVVAIGEPLGMEIGLSIVSTAVWSLLFIGTALWRFNRYEF